MRRAATRSASFLDTKLVSYWPLRLDLGSMPPVLCSIGYGSGVFRQTGYTGPRPMVDVVLLVQDTDVEDWHRENLKANPMHYSSTIRMLGAGAAATLQRWGPGLYYNTHVQLPAPLEQGGTVNAKYGVMSMEDLLEDLTEWRHLYMAGRMQKPCAVRWQDTSDEQLMAKFDAAVTENRRAALCAGILCLEWATAYGGRQLSQQEILEAVVKLSYYGDIRMPFAENPEKVANIVKGQKDDLWSIYRPIAKEFGVYPAQDFAERLKLFRGLPSSVRVKTTNAVGRNAAEERAWEEPQFIKEVLYNSVQKASAVQTMKGALSAGPVKGLKYALRKVGKRFGA